MREGGDGGGGEGARNASVYICMGWLWLVGSIKL